ncbi:MAG: sporulation integral membrane protein YtvI [Alicyclobacillus sp. RIFOXYA1_FULL_53_8]|nr:MAG: sporulation integral membrane protein YtvI [Alicyclobacillus sp. RIFOXYA1_FULL_53_8]
MSSSSQQQVQVRRYLWRLFEVAALLVFVTLISVFFVWALRYILPFVVGWFLAILLLPLVKFLERRHVKSIAAALSVLIGSLAVIVVLSVFAVIAIAREASLLLVNVPQYFNGAQAWVQQQILMGKVFFGQLPPNVVASIQNAAMQSISSLEAWFRSFAKILLDSVTRLPEFSFVVVISLITAYFMLADRERLYRGFLRSLPPGWSGKMEAALNDMGRAFTGTIRVQVVLMLMSAVLGVVGMWVLGIEYAVLLGIAFGVTGLVPFLGSAILTVPWAVGALAMGDVALAIKILLLQLVISAIRHVVEPKILADSVGLDTLSTLFALYVGMQLLGVLGLFLGPIILIGFKSLFRARLFVDFFPADKPAKRVVEDGKQT